MTFPEMNVSKLFTAAQQERGALQARRNGTASYHALRLPHPRHEPLHSPHHLRKTTVLHSLHHLAHLLELVEQAIDFLHRDTRSSGDAALARGLDDLGPDALGGSHGVDDALDAAQLLFVHLRGLQALSELRGQFVDHGGDPAHPAHLADLLLEVLQIEALALLHLLGEFFRLVDVDRLSRLFDEREHVAHAEDARGHALGVKKLQAVRLLAHARELDRLPRDLAYRERRAAARVAVALGEHDPGERQRVAESLR